MIPMPLVLQPFEQIAMDPVGPLPHSHRGNHFILILVDYATRYPEAMSPCLAQSLVGLPKSLLTLFSRVGIPEEILSDKGANFMGKLKQEIYELLHIKHIQTSLYHPQTDGLVARWMVWWSDSMVHQRACYGSL